MHQIIQCILNLGDLEKSVSSNCRKIITWYVRIVVSHKDSLAIFGGCIFCYSVLLRQAYITLISSMIFS